MTETATPLRAHAYSSFTEKLLSKAIEPGQFVSQRELVALTGMPLGAIREMIPRLEADGLIRTSPKRGLQVMPIDLNLIRDAFQFRRIIECEAVGQFCRSAADNEIKQLADEHQSIVAEAERGVDNDLLHRAQHLDWDFHDRLINHMQNQIVSEAYRVNAIKIRLIANADALMLPDLVVAVMKEHLPVIEALKSRDEDAAVTALAGHIESAKRRALHL